jgi:hypothetical protein
MIKMFNQSTRLPHLTKTKGFILASLVAGAMALPLFIPAQKAHADNDRHDGDGNQSWRQNLAGTWKSAAEPGVPPQLASFMSDGRLIFSRTITVVTGPTSVELVGTGHGEWIRTGQHEFASTMFLIRSGPSVEFTGLVKVTSTYTLNRNSDQLTSTGTVYIYDADNNLLFSFPSPGSGVYNRVTVGQ